MVYLHADVPLHSRLGRHHLHADADNVVYRVSARIFIMRLS